jgi:nitrogen fixation protein FixH
MGWIPRERIWPTIVVVALAGNVALGITLARIAGSDPSFAVEPDYYAKAVAWDSVQAQRDRNRELGWQVTPRLGPVTEGATAELTLGVADRDGAPLLGATLTVEAMPVVQASHVVTATLTDRDGTGAYRAPVAVDRAGLWELRLTAVRGAERFTANLRLDASATAVATIITSRPGDPVLPASGT